jgi:hypothetical protein
VFNIEQNSGEVLWHSTSMKKKELTGKQLSLVPCPTCGAAIRERCELHSGAARSEPHVGRKFAAIAAIERKTAHAINHRSDG